MAEKNSHETWSVTDSSRERADRSGGKPPVAKTDSGLGGDTEPLDRDCLCQVSDCEGGGRGREEVRKRKRGVVCQPFLLLTKGDCTTINGNSSEFRSLSQC